MEFSQNTPYHIVISSGLEKVFKEKNLVTVSFFKKTVLYTHILNTYLFQ